MEPIAIVGIGCRFPGGVTDPGSFWTLLSGGVDAVVEVPPDRWNSRRLYHPDPASRPGTVGTRLGGFLSDIDMFDAGFFGISPREAALMDPQQRLLLESTFDALEDGGQSLDRLSGTPVGVFIGIAAYDYAEIQHSPENRELITGHTNTGLALSIAANRISYAFNFTGPSLAVDTACSSSLVALHLACQSLWRGESRLAVAGGVNAILKPEPTIGFSRASMLAPDGRCKAFDARANGYTRGEGAGVVILEPLSAARA
ncbi:MAG TPA: polyketide synthase, partial [Methylomirabilota bacterium]|nr:polyketide synthase [Methylomirabilota bacterium]